MVVHGVVYRESKVIEQKILPEIKNVVIFENEEQKSDNEKENVDNSVTKERMSNEKPLDGTDSNKQSKDSTRKFS
jgi:hypothetical protein